jgi:hypothetical protein
MNLHLSAAAAIVVLALVALGWGTEQFFGGSIPSATTGLTPAADDLHVHEAVSVLQALRPELLTAETGNPFAPPAAKSGRRTAIPLPPPPATAFPPLPVLPVAEAR